MNEWLRGFFEANVTFCIGINLLKSAHKRFVVLKPMVVVSNNDITKIQAVIKELGLDIKVSVQKMTKNRNNPTYSINIQRFKDIETIIKMFEKEPFISDSRKKSFDTFKEAYELIVNDVGYIKTAWEDKMQKVLELKSLINKEKRTKKGFTPRIWKIKIIKHTEVDT